MPQTPEDLSRIIREMARKISEKMGVSITEEAVKRIGEVPKPYSQQSSISVELGKLESMIDDVLRLASKIGSGKIDLPSLERALDEVDCHYLWFC